MVLRKRIFLKGQSYSRRQSLINPGSTKFSLMFTEIFFFLKAPKTSLNINKSSIRVSPFPYHLIINSSSYRISVLIREMAPVATLTISLVPKWLHAITLLKSTEDS